MEKKLCTWVDPINCSQPPKLRDESYILWSLKSSGLIEEVEGLQRTFISEISPVKSLNNSKYLPH